MNTVQLTRSEYYNIKLSDGRVIPVKYVGLMPKSDLSIDEVPVFHFRNGGIVSTENGINISRAFKLQSTEGTTDHFETVLTVVAAIWDVRDIVAKIMDTYPPDEITYGSYGEVGLIFTERVPRLLKRLIHRPNFQLANSFQTEVLADAGLCLTLAPRRDYSGPKIDYYLEYMDAAQETKQWMQEDIDEARRALQEKISQLRKLNLLQENF